MQCEMDMHEYGPGIPKQFSFLLAPTQEDDGAEGDDATGKIEDELTEAVKEERATPEDEGTGVEGVPTGDYEREDVGEEGDDP